MTHQWQGLFFSMACLPALSLMHSLVVCERHLLPVERPTSCIRSGGLRPTSLCMVRSTTAGIWRSFSSQQHEFKTVTDCDKPDPIRFMPRADVSYCCFVLQFVLTVWILSYWNGHFVLKWFLLYWCFRTAIRSYCFDVVEQELIFRTEIVLTVFLLFGYWRTGIDISH